MGIYIIHEEMHMVIVYYTDMCLYIHFFQLYNSSLNQPARLRVFKAVVTDTYIYL